MSYTTSTSLVDLEQMRAALREASRCVPTPTAFCVGCVLVIPRPFDESQESSPSESTSSGSTIVLATGYSRELEGNTHAEANALAKAHALSTHDLHTLINSSSNLTSSETTPSVAELLQSATVYTTLEPCSVRTSGLAPCADALVAAGVRRVVIGVGEPKDFVVCEGAERLVRAGIEVCWLAGLEKECLLAARRGHDGVDA